MTPRVRTTDVISPVGEVSRSDRGVPSPAEERPYGKAHFLANTLIR